MVVTVLSPHSAYDIFQTCVCWVATIDIIPKCGPRIMAWRQMFGSQYTVPACSRWLWGWFYFLLFHYLPLFFFFWSYKLKKKTKPKPVKVSLWKYCFLHEEVKYLFPGPINPTFPYLAMIWCSLICIFTPVIYKELFFTKWLSETDLNVTLEHKTWNKKTELNF